MKTSSFVLLLNIFLAITVTTPSKAKAYKLSGRVITQDGVGISKAQVYVSQTHWAITAEDGSFTIKDIPPGDYQLLISHVSYKTLTVSVSIPQVESAPSFILEEKVYNNKPVVVTASRTQKDLEDVSVPIAVVGDKEIQMSGSLRLSDILAEQIGMNIVSDHGTGIQVQGFDPEYTLIMIDNQPVIGRTAGTLDLTRLAVGNIKQIEIVKGPSSALWGSEALAGVINIITEKGSEPFRLDLNSRYGTFNNYDASSNLSFKADKLTGRFFADMNGSDGYDLDKATLAPTVAEYQNYTFQSGLDYRVSENLRVKLGGRFYQEDNFSRAEVDIDNQEYLLVSDNWQKDYNLSPEVALNLGSSQLIELIGFSSRFESLSSEVIESTNQSFYESTFNQTLNRLELKSTTFWSDTHTSVFGSGFNQENLVSENYSEVPTFSSGFLYGQHEWQIFEELSLTSGFRFDVHSEYSSQLSPKFSALYKPTKKLHIKVSLGGGFKAPTFNQLFLNFTNSTVGYTVFGTSNVETGMDALEESGRIAKVIVPVSQVSDINAENSVSYNAGIDYYLTDQYTFKINFFRNNIRDMIDSRQIAVKDNGQSVFSYFNLNRVFTQGFESEFRFSLPQITGLDVHIGYQFLDARQKFEILYDVVENGRVVSKTRTEYGTLPNRSKHTANLKLFYVMEDLGLEASLRANFRGKFGFDANGNGRISSNEYVFTANNLKESIDKTMIDFSLAKTFFNRLRWMVGIDNITGFTNPRFLPSIPGRTYFTQLTLNLY